MLFLIPLIAIGVVIVGSSVLSASFLLKVLGVGLAFAFSPLGAKASLQSSDTAKIVLSLAWVGPAVQSTMYAGFTTGAYASLQSIAMAGISTLTAVLAASATVVGAAVLLVSRRSDFRLFVYLG